MAELGPDSQRSGAIPEVRPIIMCRHYKVAPQVSLRVIVATTLAGMAHAAVPALARQQGATGGLSGMGILPMRPALRARSGCPYKDLRHPRSTDILQLMEQKIAKTAKMARSGTIRFERYFPTQLTDLPHPLRPSRASVSSAAFSRFNSGISNQPG